MILATDESSTDLAAISAARLGGRAIALAGVVVVAGVVLSRLLGWVRLAVFGAEFGAGANLDAFYAAFRIPDTLFQLVAAGAIGSAVVPVASELVAQGDAEGARRLISTITNLMVLVLAPAGGHRLARGPGPRAADRSRLRARQDAARPST